MPTLWWRSVGHTHTGYAVECFVDEFLQAAGKDPVAGRLELMTKAPACGRCTAGRRGACEVERAGSGQRAGAWRCGGGKLQHLRRADCRRSPTAAMTDRAFTRSGARSIAALPSIPMSSARRSRAASAIGLGHVLFAEVTLDQGRPMQTNFDTYRSLRINEMPEVEVVIVPSTEKADRRRRTGCAADWSRCCQCDGAARAATAAAIAVCEGSCMND